MGGVAHPQTSAAVSTIRRSFATCSSYAGCWSDPKVVWGGVTCPRSTACPTCRAGARADCRRPSGHRAASVHVDRVYAAEDQDIAVAALSSRESPRSIARAAHERGQQHLHI